MARTEKTNTQNIINIKSLPVQAHIGASKFVNDDWGTIAFIIPRDQLQLKFTDNELRYNCIYFLFGYGQKTEKVYVGQAKKRNNGESVLARLREHDASTTERYCDIWKWVVVCTGKEDTWNLDDLNALEHAFYNEIPTNQSLNGNNPNSGGANYDAYIDKIKQIKNYITSIGFDIFADTEDTEKIQVTSEVNENTIVEDLQNGLARIPEIVTPHKVVKAMCDILPSEVWNDHTVFLDPACKGGEYLREIYDRLMDCEIMQSKYPDEFERSNHILSKQLYGIALSQVSLERTTKKLRGYDHNLRVIPNYIGLLKGIKYGNNMQEIINREFNRDITIDVVIGNPPYQENTGGGQSGGMPLYNFFIRLISILNTDYSSLIIPARWYMDGRKSSQEVRDIILSQYTSIIVDIPNSKDAFLGVTIQGGVMYFLRNKNNINNCKIYTNDTYNKSFEVKLEKNYFIRDRIAYKIYTQIRQNNEQTADSVALPVNPYGLLRADTGSVCKIHDDDLEVISSQGIGYISRDAINKNKHTINKYKVIVGYGITTPDKVITTRRLKPGQVCTLTYCVVGILNSEEYAILYEKYLQLKTIRYLIRASLTNSSVTHENFKLVPLLDIRENWTDEGLYKKYGLTPEEISHIEKSVKALD